MATPYELTPEFEAFRAVPGNLPDYSVIPVTKHPVPYGTEVMFTLTWQAVLVPAIDVPNDRFFRPAGYGNNVEIHPDLGVRGDRALLFLLVSHGVTEAKRREHRLRMQTTMRNMEILANRHKNPEKANELFFFEPETAAPDLF